MTSDMEIEVIAKVLADLMVAKDGDAQTIESTRVNMSDGDWRATAKPFVDMITKDPIYRLQINRNSSVDIECYDLIENFSPELSRYYDHVDYLPQWVKAKLAVLMVIDPKAPGGREVQGVGKRINKVVYWIYKNGENSGSSCESSYQENTG